MSEHTQTYILFSRFEKNKEFLFIKKKKDNKKNYQRQFKEIGEGRNWLQLTKQNLSLFEHWRVNFQDGSESLNPGSQRIVTRLS